MLTYTHSKTPPNDHPFYDHSNIESTFLTIRIYSNYLCVKHPTIDDYNH